MQAGREGLGQALQEGGAGEEGVAHGFGGEGGGGLGRDVEVCCSCCCCCIKRVRGWGDRPLCG